MVAPVRDSVMARQLLLRDALVFLGAVLSGGVVKWETEMDYTENQRTESHERKDGQSD